ncbi:MAG: NAD(P)H-hydrate dehydratase [Verrucomicrobiota bacterium]|nr:NAD(P)H-hydrate dehydratase [Verrucomicrobiota bacterium]
MRAWEKVSWEAGKREESVIAQVGKEIARAVLERTAPEDSILLLAGSGHNGDDVRAAVPHLCQRKLQLLEVTEPKKSLHELTTALQDRPRFVVDGLFGIGLNRPLGPDWVELIGHLNQSTVPVISIDVPSGLDANSGKVETASVQAEITLTVGAPKTGLLQTGAAQYVGRLVVLENTGLVPCPIQTEWQWTIESDFKEYPPLRRVDSHKGTYGHVAIVGGSLGYHGAAILAARGAMRAMPGLVSVMTSPHVYTPVASQLQGAMVHPFRPVSKLPENSTALVIGPGLAAPEAHGEFAVFTNDCWQDFPLPVIVDASALDWLESGHTPLNSRRIITPHPGEAARMLNCTAMDIQENRFEALRRLSSKFGNCWVILKGHHTLIGRNHGEIFINSSGNPFMAQGGTGDVLAGFLGGLLAQPRLQANPVKALRYGVWRHGTAADSLTDRQDSWSAEDLARSL